MKNSVQLSVIFKLHEEPQRIHKEPQRKEKFTITKPLNYSTFTQWTPRATSLQLEFSQSLHDSTFNLKLYPTPDTRFQALGTKKYNFQLCPKFNLSTLTLSTIHGNGLRPVAFFHFEFSF